MQLRESLSSSLFDRRVGRACSDSSLENFPLEVTYLLEVLARIEVRRQARLRALYRKEVG